MNLTNTDDQTWLVSLYLNTGLPFSPFFDPNNFYQTGFTSLAPGESTTLVLNFESLGVINRSRTTNLGFQVGGDLVSANPDNFEIRAQAAAIPESSSALALIAFTVVMGRVNRQQS